MGIYRDQRLRRYCILKTPAWLFHSTSAMSTTRRLLPRRAKEQRKYTVESSSSEDEYSVSHDHCSRARLQPTTKTQTPVDQQRNTWRPPAGSWECHIQDIDMCKDKDGNLVVLLTWNNGRRTRHNTEKVYSRCPRRVSVKIEN